MKLINYTYYGYWKFNRIWNHAKVSDRGLSDKKQKATEFSKNRVK